VDTDVVDDPVATLDLSAKKPKPARGVFRYTVNQRLEPGEYACVKMTNEGISSYVWDFGIDPLGSKSQI
jgi:hypothetical protein